MLNMLNKIFRVFKFSQRPAQVTGYFKHLPLEVLFAFQILLTTQFCFTKWSWSDLFEEINKCQLMKIVIKQCVYYITFWSSKRELFLMGKSARVPGLSFERTCIGAAADLFSRESFNMKKRQQRMLSFLSTAEKSRRQTSNNNFRNKS